MNRIRFAFIPLRWILLCITVHLVDYDVCFCRHVDRRDIIFVSKNLKNKWELKQHPKVNGAIVVIDPYNGKVKVPFWYFLLGRKFDIKRSEWHRTLKIKKNG